MHLKTVRNLKMFHESKSDNFSNLAIKTNISLSFCQRLMKIKCISQASVQGDYSILKVFKAFTGYRLFFSFWSSIWLNCVMGIRPLFQYSSPPRAGPVFLLVPSFYQALPGSTYSFPLVMYSSPLSAGVLHEHLCLKV